MLKLIFVWVSFFLLRLLSTKYWRIFTCLGKQGRMEKQKLHLERKKNAPQLLVSFNFLVLRVNQQSRPKYIGTNKQVHVRHSPLTSINNVVSVCRETSTLLEGVGGQNFSFKHCFQLCHKTCSKYFGQNWRSVPSPVLIELRCPKEHCPMKFKFRDYLGSFFMRRYFKLTSPHHVMLVLLLNILAYNRFMALTLQTWSYISWKVVWYDIPNWL